MKIENIKELLKNNVSAFLLGLVLLLNLGSMILSSVSDSVVSKRDDKCKLECLPSSYQVLEAPSGKKECWCYVDDSSLKISESGDEN